MVVMNTPVGERSARASLRTGAWMMTGPASLAALIILITAATAVGYAKKEFVMPPASSAKTFPARDEHSNEKVTLAADPYDAGDKLAIFEGKYWEHDLMPVFLVITNDSGQPISLASMKVE